MIRVYTILAVDRNPDPTEGVQLATSLALEPVLVTPVMGNEAFEIKIDDSRDVNRILQMFKDLGYAVEERQR